MPKSVTDEEIRAALAAVKTYGSQQAAAKHLKIPISTLKHRVRKIAKRESITVEDPEILLPDLPSSELGAEELIEQACNRFAQHQTARDARRWMPIKVKANKPIAVCFMGDPHVDNNGCNWPLLKQHINILEKTEGLYAVNIGDLTDNWIGRLMRIYADAEMSKKQAWKLAKYILKDCDIKWLCHILGNHDLWGDGAYMIKANAHPMVPVEEWQSRFKICFPNGVEIKVFAAHDFPGNSIWNKLHGPQRAALLNDEAHIYACGHKHEWGMNTTEHPHRNFIYHLIRSRGYKFIDSYSDTHMFGSQKYGASITAVIDPTAKDPNRIIMFADLAEAADYLEYKRAKK